MADVYARVGRCCDLQQVDSSGAAGKRRKNLQRLAAIRSTARDELNLLQKPTLSFSNSVDRYSTTPAAEGAAGRALQQNDVLAVAPGQQKGNTQHGIIAHVRTLHLDFIGLSWRR